MQIFLIIPYSSCETNTRGVRNTLTSRPRMTLAYALKNVYPFSGPFWHCQTQCPPRTRSADRGDGTPRYSFNNPFTPASPAAHPAPSTTQLLHPGSLPGFTAQRSEVKAKPQKFLRVFKARRVNTCRHNILGTGIRNFLHHHPMCRFPSITEWRQTE